MEDAQSLGKVAASTASAPAANGKKPIFATEESDDDEGEATDSSLEVVEQRPPKRQKGTTAASPRKKDQPGQAVPSAKLAAMGFMKPKGFEEPAKAKRKRNDS